MDEMAAVRVSLFLVSTLLEIALALELIAAGFGKLSRVVVGLRDGLVASIAGFYANLQLPAHF